MLRVAQINQRDREFLLSQLFVGEFCQRCVRGFIDESLEVLT